MHADCQSRALWEGTAYCANSSHHHCKLPGMPFLSRCEPVATLYWWQPQPSGMPNVADLVSACLIERPSCSLMFLLFSLKSLASSWETRVLLSVSCVVSYVSLDCLPDSKVLIYNPHWELIKAAGSHGSSSLIFMIRVMVWHIMSDTSKVVTVLILVVLILILLEMTD